MKFGEFVRSLRAENRVTLREFCHRHKHDPSNWSKMERGELPPPQNEDELETLARQLDLHKGSQKWQLFIDLAFIERGRIPAYIMRNEKLVEALPLFFRTLEGRKPSDEELSRIRTLIIK